MTSAKGTVMPRISWWTFALVAFLCGVSFAADQRRQADVASRGVDVMPFRLDATTHVFTKTATGGTQRVVAKDPTDAVQTGLVRRHLRELQSKFRSGNFDGPTHIHGGDMPGLAALVAAKPGEIRISYRNVAGGAELTYQPASADLVESLHAWFDAQLADHGADAMAGHDHEHMHDRTAPK